MRIVVDGSSVQLHDRHGEDVLNRLAARSIDIKVEKGKTATATIEVAILQLRVAGRAAWVMPHPEAGLPAAIRSIMFADGTSITISDDGEVEVRPPVVDGEVAA